MQMGLFFRAIMYRVKNKAKVILNGLMAAHIKVNFLRIQLMVKDYLFGLMDVVLMGSGSITKWRELVYSSGQMVENTMVNTRMT